MGNLCAIGRPTHQREPSPLPESSYAHSDTQADTPTSSRDGIVLSPTILAPPIRETLEQMKLSASDFTYIAPHIAATPCARDAYRSLANLIKPSGGGWLESLENTGNSADITLITTRPTPAGDIFHVTRNQSADGIVHHGQVIVHFQPEVGRLTNDNHLIPPAAITAHQLAHAHQDRTVSLDASRAGYWNKRHSQYGTYGEMDAKTAEWEVADKLGHEHRSFSPYDSIMVHTAGFTSAQPQHPATPFTLGDHSQNVDGLFSDLPVAAQTNKAHVNKACNFSISG